MTKSPSKLAELLDRLERFYGKPKPRRPTNPYEMILQANCGYPATDASCTKGFDALKKEVGLRPDNILAAPDAKLTELMRLGGIIPQLRAARLKEIAALVKRSFGGDLRAVLKKPLPEAKKALKKFPTIGDPRADKILLFTKTAPVAAVPSNCVHVLLRLGFGDEKKNYAASYRSAQEAIHTELPEECGAPSRVPLAQATRTGIVQAFAAAVRTMSRFLRLRLFPNHAPRQLPVQLRVARREADPVACRKGYFLTQVCTERVKNARLCRQLWIHSE